MKKLALALLLASVFAPFASADSTVGMSVSKESGDMGEISSFSIYAQFTDIHSNFGYQIGTSLSDAEITDYSGFTDTYTAWEGFARVGYFSNIQLYLETGIDIGEMLVLDDHDSHHHYYDHREHNEVDYFFGGGFGLSQDNVDIKVFSRYRFIDGDYLWDTDGWFSGVEFSLHF
ncbi:MAG: hypothetical protein HWE27_18440 [Gammaproteobacteria bacterium]|nr:hypothetical protein [Gammaproteobacteria bacterium]